MKPSGLFISLLRKMFCADVQRGDEAHLLKDHADAGVLGGLWGVFGQGGAIDLDRAQRSAHGRR